METLKEEMEKEAGVHALLIQVRPAVYYLQKEMAAMATTQARVHKNRCLSKSG